jgi:hypothetical protein
VQTVGEKLNLNRTDTLNEIANFFEDKTLLVSPTGFQKYLYKVGTFAQTSGSKCMVVRTITIAKSMGVTGIKLIQGQPLMVIALPTVGAIFFHGCGQIIGNNTLGRTCNTIGNILNLPMAFTELCYNTYIAPTLNSTFGIVTILNYTKQAQRGPGLDLKEAVQLIKGKNEASIFSTIKCAVIKRLGDKC